MLWEYFETVQWLAYVGMAGLAFGRLIKAIWPTMPKVALPFAVMAFCYAVVTGDLLYYGIPVERAAVTGLAALLSGGLAIMAHETTKKTLSGLLDRAGLNGEMVSEMALGVLKTKLPKLPDDHPPKVTPEEAAAKAKTTALIVVALLASWCAAPCRSAMLLSAYEGEQKQCVEMAHTENEGRACLDGVRDNYAAKFAAEGENIADAAADLVDDVRELVK